MVKRLAVLLILVIVMLGSFGCEEIEPVPVTGIFQFGLLDDADKLANVKAYLDNQEMVMESYFLYGKFEGFKFTSYAIPGYYLVNITYTINDNYHEIIIGVLVTSSRGGEFLVILEE